MKIAPPSNQTVPPTRARAAQTAAFVAHMTALAAGLVLFACVVLAVVGSARDAQARARACPTYQLEKAQEQRYTALETEMKWEWSAHQEKGKLLSQLEPSPKIRAAYEAEEVALHQRNTERVAAHRAACIREREELARKILRGK